MLTYCGTEENLGKELAYIREIGEQHGYRKGFLRQILMEVKRSVKGAGEERERPRRECVRFVPVLFHLRNIRMVKEVVRRKGACMAPKRNLMIFCFFYLGIKLIPR